MIFKKQYTLSALLATGLLAQPLLADESMDKMWGDSHTQASAETSARAQFFDDSNYGMFIHWGLYSNLGGQWKNQTFYGIGEWIKRQMQIPGDEYQALAGDFNPSQFDAKAIVRTAKAAGMKYIIITSKHHEGFAMFDSEHPFNIVDASPFARDPMKELADACREADLGFGFYYSHNQDWTSPGAHGGPKVNPDGSKATFEKYFREKCYPQVKEICTNYGPLSFVWFDTPGSMPKEFVMELVDLVRETQPNAMLCSRVGHGMGDYLSLGDMEVPARNHEGLWETCDTTNDSWSYAWYDQNWKDSKTILHRLVATVGRGGSYLLNVGPDGTGRVPAPAAEYLVEAGEWLQKHPNVVYAAGPSPWGAAMPWGDVTTYGEHLNLVVFEWPTDGRIHLSGLEADIDSAGLRTENGELLPLKWSKQGSWVMVDAGGLTREQASGLASVIELKLKAAPVIDPTLGVHPNLSTLLLAEFATAEGATKKGLRWMEKFGEWKHVTQVGEWQENGLATWEVDVAEAGAYYLDLTYRGEDRPVWSIATDEGVTLQNQQAATSGYHAYPFGILNFKQPGKHKIMVSLVEGDPVKSSLKSIRLTPAR
ncbi:MAG: alpha-L-fucosidase [Opitutae bacterium]|nr:alpha-L-fucosidase [Opitutae bacterium]MDG1301839.1 alpha-L-fucosidase [Opitutae bacterium]